MCKKKVVVTPGSRVSVLVPVPAPTLWYLEPIGEYSNWALLSKLPAERISPQVTCSDGVLRDFLSVTHAEVEFFEEGRKTDKDLHFSVWYKSKTSEKVELWKIDYSYTHSNPSLYPCYLQRKLKKSLVGVGGVPASFPRKRKDTLR